MTRRAGLPTCLLCLLWALAAAGGPGCYLAHERGGAPAADAGPADAPSPVEGPEALSLSAGGRHSCAVWPAGAVWCWGDNGAGQLGVSPDALALSPAPMRVPGLADATEVSGGDLHTCALRRGGRVSCWGRDRPGRTAARPPEEIRGLGDVVAVASGDELTCVLARGGSVSCWGTNHLGQLGDGSTTSRDEPRAVPGIEDATQLSVGTSHVCVVRRGGAIACWGSNDGGRLGIGDDVVEYVPRPVPVREITDAVQVSAGGGHTCALRRGGRVLCWGGNAAGQTGQPARLRFFSAPREVEDLAGVVDLAAGYVHTCALLGDGGVRCFGENLEGALGDGTLRDSHTPVAPDRLGAASLIAAGGVQRGPIENHSCAALRDGRVYCWGVNERGQCGDGTRTMAEVPVRVRLAAP